MKSSLLLYTLLISLFFSAFPLHAGISDTIDNIQNTIKNIADTIEKISAVIDTTTDIARQLQSVTGTQTIIFLIGVLLICAGIGPTGLISGRALFFTAAALADFIWFFLIGAAYNSPAALVSDMVRANLWIILPFIIVYFLTKGVPYVYRKIRRYFFSSSLPQSRTEDILFNINMIHADLFNSISEDIKNSDGSTVKISPATRGAANSLIEQLDELRWKNK